MKPPVAFLIALMPCLLGGCAAPILGPLTLSHLSTIASATTMTIEGKGAAEVALDIATGKDCRMMEGVVREDRAICEENGSAATDDDFKGVIAFIADRPPQPKTRPGAPETDTKVMLTKADSAPTHTVRSLKRAPRNPEQDKAASSVTAATQTTDKADVQFAAVRRESPSVSNKAASGIVVVSAPNATKLPGLAPIAP